VILAALTYGPSESGAERPIVKTDTPVIGVRDEASFKEALARARAGTTIQLADGRYPELSVVNRLFTAPVLIVGSRNVELAGMSFENSKNIVLRGVTVAPPAQATAEIAVKAASQKIVIDRVLVDGRSEEVGAFIRTTRDTSDVTIQNSAFTNCGRAGTCVRPGATNLRVIGNRFYDCRSCTFIKGGGNGALVRRNAFDLAHNVGCTGGTATCPHNDLIQIMGGGPWTIVGNRFGNYFAGAAQVYANPGLTNTSNPIHDLLIASNIFAGDNGGFGIRVGVGEKSTTPPPTNVRIVNNTILSGQLSSVFLTTSWDQVPVAERPLVANNILRSVHTSCARGRFIGNLVLDAPSCPHDRVGDPKLNARTKAPTTRSKLIVNRADGRYAPKTDFYGHRRKGRPDIGAIELGGR